MNWKLLIVDDHEVVRVGLSALLDAADITVVGTAGDAEEALEKATSLQPDLVLMDIRMAGTDGLLAMSAIREKMPETRFVMLSTYDNPTYVARSVALGAADYVLKGSSRETLIAAITRAAAGDPPPENSLLHGIKETMARLRDRQDAGDVPLTNRELQVLRHVALGLSNR